MISQDELKEIKETTDKSTRVNAWYPHSQHDGYHPGRASVRGPFGRWFLVEGGESSPGALGSGVADLYDDARYAAMAMNKLPKLVDEISSLLSENERLTRQLECAKRFISDIPMPHHPACIDFGIDNRASTGCFSKCPHHKRRIFLAEIERMGGGK